MLAEIFRTCTWRIALRVSAFEWREQLIYRTRSFSRFRPRATRRSRAPPGAGERREHAVNRPRWSSGFRVTCSTAGGGRAEVKVVQQMLGHKTATRTLDLYGHLFPDRLDEVADRMDGSASASRSACAPDVPHK